MILKRKISQWLRLVIFCFFFLFAASCSIDVEEEPLIVIQPITIEINAEMATFDIDVNANVDFDITIDDEWITKVVASQTTVILHVQENTATTERTGIVTFKQKGGNASATLTVIQTPNPLLEVFIAHAGGKIGKHTYTNSLEALNYSYDMGCRMFELDICETSDGVFVGVHDWKHFKTISGYTGIQDASPLSEQEFLSLTIYGTYTPMNISAINAWFESHKDAILVTDKVNQPKRFTEQFLFKDRLIMELFSWDAVVEALEIDVKAMPSQNLVFGTRNIQRLDDLNIKYIAVSRRVISGNEEFFEQLKNKNIKTYIYHVNFDEGKNEQYVFENELKWITGMYADNLSLLKSPISQ